MPRMPRTISRPAVRAIVDVSAVTIAAPATWPTVLATRPAADGGGAGAGAPCAIGSAGCVPARREASASRALTRSMAWPYSRRKSLWRMSAWSSSGVSGAILDAGGMSRVATTGVGDPRLSSTVTTASPMPSEVSVSSRS